MLFILYFTRQDIKKNFLVTVTAWASARRHLQGGRRERGQTKNQDKKKTILILQQLTLTLTLNLTSIQILTFT